MFSTTNHLHTSFPLQKQKSCPPTVRVQVRVRVREREDNVPVPTACAKAKRRATARHFEAPVSQCTTCSSSRVPATKKKQVRARLSTWLHRYDLWYAAASSHVRLGGNARPACVHVHYYYIRRIFSGASRYKRRCMKCDDMSTGTHVLMEHVGGQVFFCPARLPSASYALYRLTTSHLRYLLQTTRHDMAWHGTARNVQTMTYKLSHGYTVQ